MSTDPNASVEAYSETPSGSQEQSQSQSASQPSAPAKADIPPYETDLFKKKVIEAGFPGSPQTDPAFLAALYRFSLGGDSAEKSETEETREPVQTSESQSQW